MRKHWPKSSRGTGLMTRYVVVRGAEEKHRGLVNVLATRHKPQGYDVDVRWFGKHFIVGLWRKDEPR